MQLVHPTVPPWLVLRQGAYLTVAVLDDALVYARHLEGSATLVAVNRGASPVSLALPELPIAVAAGAIRTATPPRS